MSLVAQLACTLLACAAASTASGAIIWNEATSGDLPELYRFVDPPSPTNTTQFLGSLAPGANTITGTNIQQSGGSGNLFEGDAIRFVIDPGTTISSIVFEHNQSAGLREFLQVSGSSTLSTYVFRNFPATNLPSPNYNVVVTHDLIAMFAPGGSPLGPGEYLISWDNATFNTTMTYTMTINVTPSPAFWPVGMAAGGLVLARRRRTSHN